MLLNLGRYVALDRENRRTLACAFVWLAIVDLALRFAGFRRIVRFVREAPPNTSTVDPAAMRRAQRYARWLEVASRHHIVRARCLHRSLVLHYWLRGDGLPSRLRIGVRSEGRSLQAHSWVELGGQAVNEQPAAVAAFTPLAPPRVWRAGGYRRRHEQGMWS